MNKTPTNDGGPAFPVPMFQRQADGQPMTAGDFFEGGNGMSLRDWFAGMALQGLCASMTEEESKENEHALSTVAKHFAIASYGYADAMLAARERKEDA